MNFENVIPFPKRIHHDNSHRDIESVATGTDDNEGHFMVSDEDSQSMLSAQVNTICNRVFEALRDLRQEREFLAKTFLERDIPKQMGRIRIGDIRGATQWDYLIAADIINLLIAPENESVWVDKRGASSIVVEPKGKQKRKLGMVRGGKR